MVSTKLEFFAGLKKSKLGVLRGLTSFVFLFFIFFSIFMFSFKKQIYKNFIIAFIISGFLCSAIGVQLPTNIEDVFLYSFLVGLTIGSICTSFHFLTESKKNKFMMYAWLFIPIILVPISCVSYKINEKLNLFPK